MATPLLHDPLVRSDLSKRVRMLRPDARGRWGKMTVDQMLWHVNEGLRTATGDLVLPAITAPVPKALMKFIVLKLPWMKGAPTAPSFQAKGAHDFVAEQARCLRLIEAVAAKPVAGLWMQHPLFGPMTGDDVSRLQAKHLEHHLTQFGV